MKEKETRRVLRRVFDSDTITWTDVHDFVQSYGFEGFYPSDHGVEIVISLDVEGQRLVSGVYGDIVARHEFTGQWSPDEFWEWLNSLDNWDAYNTAVWDLFYQLGGVKHDWCA